MESIREDKRIFDLLRVYGYFQVTIDDRALQHFCALIDRRPDINRVMRNCHLTAFDSIEIQDIVNQREKVIRAVAYFFECIRYTLRIFYVCSSNTGHDRPLNKTRCSHHSLGMSHPNVCSGTRFCNPQCWYRSLPFLSRRFWRTSSRSACSS